MILTCPSCQTRYFADDASIGPNGRSVRCASCGHTWFCEGQLLLDQTAPEDLLPAATATATTAARKPLTRDQVERMRQAASGVGASPVTKLRQQQADRERRDRVRVAIGAWSGAGVALAASAAGAVAFREDVAAMWPNAAGAYAAVGLDVNVYGLEFSDLDIDRTYEGPTPVLVVRGSVRNIGSDLKPAPALRLALRDAKGEEIYAWVVKADSPEIVAGGAATFTAVLDNPPSQAVDLEATFASAKEALTAVSSTAPPPQPALKTAPDASDVPLALAPATHEEGGDDLSGPLPLKPQTALDDTVIRAGPLKSGDTPALPAVSTRG